MRTTKEFLKDIVVLALPIGIQILISNILQLINNIMVGSLSEVNITAVTVSTNFVWLCGTAVLGVTSGALILCAQYYGSKQIDNIRKVLYFVLCLNVGIAILFFVLISFFGEQIMHIYTNVPGADVAGVEYLNIIKYSLCMMAISQSIVSIMQSVRVVRLGFVSSSISCFVNAMVNYVLIYGRFGFPAMGIKGAAIGLLVCRVVELMVTVGYLLFMDRQLEVRMHPFEPRLPRDIMAVLFKVSIPVVAVTVLENMVSSVQTIITGHISEYYVAANTIVHSSWVLPGVFAFGISNAASIMMGNDIGSGNVEHIKTNAKRFIWLSVIEGVFSIGMLQVLLPIISAQYNVSAETLQLAKEMGMFASITCFFNSTYYIIVNGVIKSRGNTKQLLILDLIVNWLVVIPAGYFAAFVLRLPAASLYLILRFGPIIKTTWGLWQIKTDRWLQGKDLIHTA